MDSQDILLEVSRWIFNPKDVLRFALVNKRAYSASTYRVRKAKCMCELESVSRYTPYGFLFKRHVKWEGPRRRHIQYANGICRLTTAELSLCDKNIEHVFDDDYRRVMREKIRGWRSHYSSKCIIPPRRSLAYRWRSNPRPTQAQLRHHPLIAGRGFTSVTSYPQQHGNAKRFVM